MDWKKNDALGFFSTIRTNVYLTHFNEMLEQYFNSQGKRKIL